MHATGRPIDTVDAKRRLRRAALILSVGVVAAAAMSATTIALFAAVVRTDTEVIANESETLVDLETLDADSERESRISRGILMGLDSSAPHLDAARADFDGDLRRLRARASGSQSWRRGLDQIATSEQVFRATSNQAMQLARAKASDGRALFESSVVPRRRALDDAFSVLERDARTGLEGARAHARTFFLAAIAVIVVGAAVTIGASAHLAMSLTKTSGTVRELLDELERSNDDLEQFAGRVAHDLKSLVFPTQIAVTLIRQTKDDARREAALARIERASKRIETLLDGLLAFSRAGSNVNDGCARVRDVVNEVVDALAPLARDVDARVTVDVGDEVVACAHPLFFDVVMNLASNALKHLRDRPQRVLHFSTRHSGSAITLRVEDTGSGVPPELLRSLGEPFFRVPGDQTPGTGIGLATVRRIVERCGGALHFENRPDGGLAVDVRVASKSSAAFVAPAPAT